MAKLSMQIKAKDISSGKTVTTSLANVNPEASDSDKLQTAIAMNALTSNLYSSTDLIKTINLDTETEAGKQTPTFTVTNTTTTAAAIVNGQSDFAITYNGDGKFFIGDFSLPQSSLHFFFTEKNNLPTFIPVQSGGTIQPCTFKIMATETATYKAAEITVTITE